MPKTRPFGDEQQKNVNAQVANAMKMVANAQRLIEQQRQLGNIPPAKNKASPFPTNIPGTNSTGQGPRMPPSRGAGGIHIVGGTIGNAVIGSDKPVTFNQQMKVYGKGVQRTNYKILGGDFKQANIGGDTTVYNNIRSTVTTSESTTGISSEDLLLEILLKGVSTTQLIQLLEKGYSLANITFSLPNNDGHRDRMIATLLH